MDEREQIKSKREEATRARRLSLELSQRADRDRMLGFGGQLDAEADAQERTLAARGPDKTEVSRPIKLAGWGPGLLLSFLKRSHPLPSRCQLEPLLTVAFVFCCIGLTPCFVSAGAILPDQVSNYRAHSGTHHQALKCTTQRKVATCGL